MTDAGDAPAIDPREFRNVMGRFATGVTVVSFMREGAPAGMTVNSFLSVSLEPPLVLVSVRNAADFNAHMRVGECYGVNVLCEGQEHLSRYFATRPTPGSNVPFRDYRGTPLVEGSLAQLIARVCEIHPVGDHRLYIGRVEHLWYGREAKPLIFFSGRYKEVDAHEPVPRGSVVDGW